MKVKNKKVVEISHMISELWYSVRRYSWFHTVRNANRHMLVFSVDDTGLYSGGLADRFKGALSAYAWCKANGWDFRIRYVHPFELSDYLLPAGYDWILKEGEYSRCIRDARVLYVRGERGRRLLALRSGRQIHYYGNMDVLPAINSHYGTDFSWGQLFHELFRPCSRLNELVESIRKQIGSPYVSAVFRFQNLLGDFEEYSFKAEDDHARREQIIARCLDGIRDIQKRHPDTPVLVTSDSSTFLNIVSEMPGVHIIPGKVVHVGSTSGENYETYLKSFVDFYALSESQMIYGLFTPEMYKSEFPMYAAKVGDIPFERIRL